MTRLAEHGVVDLKWSEDEDDGMVMAEGLMDYEIDLNNEIAYFQDNKCVRVHEAVNFDHAVDMILAHEAVLRGNIQRGVDHRNRKVNERGWVPL
jgi:hypothetical protein